MHCSLALLCPPLCPYGGKEWQTGGTKSKAHGLGQEKFTGDNEIRKLIVTATMLIKVHRGESDSHAKMHTAAPNLTAAMQKRAITSGKNSPSPAPSNDARWCRITSGSWPCPLLPTERMNVVLTGTKKSPSRKHNTIPHNTISHQYRADEYCFSTRTRSRPVHVYPVKIC